MASESDSKLQFSSLGELLKLKIFEISLQKLWVNLKVDKIMYAEGFGTYIFNPTYFRYP